MILLILGLLDIISGILLFFARHEIMVWMATLCALLVILKGVIFIKSIPSIIDIGSGIVILLVAGGINVPYYWLFGIWLIQKGVFSVICKP